MPKHVVLPYAENTLYSTNKYSCVRRVYALFISYFMEHNRDDEPHDSSQHPIHKHPLPTFLPQCDKPSFTPIQFNRQNYSSLDLNLYIFGLQPGRQKICAKWQQSSRDFKLFLIPSWIELWFVKVVPKYLNCSILSKELLWVFILWFHPAFWYRNMAMYLVLSAFTSSSVSLLATTAEPRSIVFQGTGENRRWMRENDQSGKLLHITHYVVRSSSKVS